MTAENMQTVTSSIEAMIGELEQCILVSHDPPDAPPIILGESVLSGQSGRPAVHIDPDDLAMLATGRTTMRALGELYQCGARTIRRRMLDFGLSEPGPPVYIIQQQEDGTTHREYSAGRCANLSDLTNDELDTIMISIYEQFPSFGRRMIDGYFMALGERVPRQRIHDSYLRVIGPPVGTFGKRRIHRRVYSVAGPNSLWHHDGQHGQSSALL